MKFDKAGREQIGTEPFLGRSHFDRRETVIIRRSRAFNATSCMLG